MAHLINASVEIEDVCSSFLLVLNFVLLAKASADNVQVNGWKKMGVIPETLYPAHIDNLIVLCRNCHSLFGSTYAAWIMLPDNLDHDIDFERNDYAARVAAGERGIRKKRALPPVLFPSLF